MFLILISWVFICVCVRLVIGWWLINIGVRMWMIVYWSLVCVCSVVLIYRVVLSVIVILIMIWWMVSVWSLWICVLELIVSISVSF